VPIHKRRFVVKITSVELYRFEVLLLNAPNQRPFVDKPIICKVNVDEGVYGLGEAGVSLGVGGSAGFGMAKDLSELIIGADPMNTEAIWDKMQKKTFWGQGGGLMISAGMSAIDTALWDIKGKVLGVPLYKLLGGKTRDSLRCYASQLQFGWGDHWTPLAKPEEYAECATRAVEEGYDCIKIDPAIFDENYAHGQDFTKMLSRKQISVCHDRLAAVRDAVGADVDIIVEMHCGTDTTTAIQLGRAIEEIGVFYYEEPVMPLNPNMMKEVKDRLNFPIAAGERIYTRWGYRPFLEARSLDVIQPDLGNCGGISEGKKICDMAHLYDITVQAHVCGTPVSKAAGLHLETAIPNFIIHEHHVNALNPEYRAICKYDYQPVKGRYTVPELPGLGQELSEDAVKRAIAKEIVK
jgi:L-alanine-DL-glutamate epimerase-like enolase superfamily enzyme